MVAPYFAPSTRLDLQIPAPLYESSSSATSMLTHLDLASVPVSAETPTSTIGAYFDGLSIDELQGRLSTWNTILEKSDTPPDSDQAKTSMLSDILGATIVEAGPLGIKPGDDMWRQMFPFVEGLFSQQEVEKHKEAGYQYILKNPQRINHKFELHLPPHLQAVDHYDRMLEMIADAERAHIMVKAQLWGSDIDPPAGQTYYRFWEQLEQSKSPWRPQSHHGLC